MSDATPASGESQVDVPPVSPDSRLLTLATTHWQQLTDGERLLLSAAARGGVARFKNDPGKGSEPEGSSQCGEA